MKKRKFSIPGLYHSLVVKLVSQKWLSKYLDDPNIMGCYIHEDATVHVVKTLESPVLRHTLYHELAHHILDTLKGVGKEEDRCDLLAAYLMRFPEVHTAIEENLKKD